MSTHSPKVILAYSGGLDTSVCIRWLKEAGHRVIAFCADVGQEEPFGPIRKRALACGAERVVVQDLKAEFARDYILPALRAGAIYEGKYLLATALSRPLIAKALGAVAQREGALAAAHGCTGKGNDQVRLEVSLKILNPKLEIIAPVREWTLKSRQEEIAYALKRGLPIAKKKGAPPSAGYPWIEAIRESQFSIDENLWGVSIESGPLEDPWVQPPKEAYRWTVDPSRAPEKPSLLTIDFEHGVPVKLNGRRMSLVPLIQHLNRLGAQHGVGRADLMEDRLVGIKSREVYEAPAATILHLAHRELEQLTLDRETLAFKEGVAQRYARLIYDGLWFTPLKKGLDAFVQSTQKSVTGTVRMKLVKGNAMAIGRRSPYSRYSKGLATYAGGDRFDQKAASGFITLWGLPYVKKKRRS